MHLARSSFLSSKSSSGGQKRTSFVHGPEFEGWKKPSVDAISLANESKAFEPAKYVCLCAWPFLPSGAARNSPNVLVCICGVFIPEGSGEKRGVGALEGGTGAPSGAIEYTMMRAKESENHCEMFCTVVCCNLTTYGFSNSVSATSQFRSLPDCQQTVLL
jgi:hypothetical protein